MPIVPIRGVGTLGAIPDLHPHDTPLTGWSSVKNVRFEPEGVLRAPVFKGFQLTNTFTSVPTLIADDSHNESARSLVTVQRDGTVIRLAEGSYTSAGPETPWSPLTGQATSTKLGSMTFLNHPGGIPLVRGSADAAYTRVADDWDGDARCTSLRSYRDFLIALNVAKGGNRLRTSSHTPAAATPQHARLTLPQSISETAPEAHPAKVLT